MVARLTCTLAATCRADRPTSNRRRSTSRILRMDKRSISAPFAPAKGPILVNRVLRRPLPEAVAEWPWDQWPNARGMAGRISVEAVAECPWNGRPNERGIPSLNFVTPAQRHTHEAAAIMQQRNNVYQAARARHPRRWSREIRDWSLP